LPLTSGEWQVPVHELFALEGTRVPARTRVLREVWRHLPAWLFLVYGCLLLNCELTNLTPPRPELAPTVMFPLIAFTVYYVARALWAPDVLRRRGLLLLTLGLAFGLPTLNVAYHRPFPIAEEPLRNLYEVSNFVWAGLLAIHALSRSRSLFVLCFGAGMFYGVLLENGGILLGFFSETHLSSMVPPMVAPLATMVGWSLVLYMAFFVVRGLRAVVPWLRRSAVASALAVAGTALLFDLQLDPLATGLHCWVWAPSLPAFFHGVPLANFVAWICAIFPFAYMVLRYQERQRLPDRKEWTARQLRFTFLAAPVTLAAAATLFLGSMAVLEGTNGPSFQLLYRAASRVLGL
jgi:uncharacterized membrane protein